MSRFRRRTKAGIPLGILFALVAAIFSSRSSHRAEPAPTSQRSPTAAAAALPAARTTSAPTDDAPTAPRSAEAGGAGFTSRRHLVEHFAKHGDEFPGLSMAAYLAAAQTLRDATVGTGIVEVRRADGVVTRFDRTTGAFLAVNGDGTIRTFFKPNDGEAYFRRQASRTPGGGP